MPVPFSFRMVAHGLLLTTLLSQTALAQIGQSATELPRYQVTATRSPLALDVLPAHVTVIPGDELRQRGALDLSTALAGVAGVEVSASGDNGPAGSVPAFWGLREFDAFLLVVDGVPAGGAFNPALTTLDLSQVERIEILRGAAPVMYGATSFVGVIHVIHYPPGQGPGTLWAQAGGNSRRPGSFSVGGAQAWSGSDAAQRSVSGSLQKQRLADNDAGYLRAQGLYRSHRQQGEVQHWQDFKLSLLRQAPESPVVFEDGQATDKTSLNANHNPADAVFEELGARWNRGASRPTGQGLDVSLVSLSLSAAHVVRGFLEDPDNPAPNAEGYEQNRGLLDIYLDRHRQQQISDVLQAVYGADALLGYAAQKSKLYEYSVPLDGQQRPDLASGQRTKEGEAFDGRALLGGYGQLDWQATDRLKLIGGLRLNATYETRKGEREEDSNGNGVIDKPAEEFEAEVNDSQLRLTGTLGASWRLWQQAADHLVAYASYRNSFKPAAFEFAPEIEATILHPETANSFELGLHGRLFDGLAELELSGFTMDFKNVLVAEAQGVFNVGATRLRGAEAELQLNLGRDLSLLGGYAWHDAHYQRGSTPSGLDLSGRHLPMAPRHSYNVGLRFDSPQAFFGQVLFSHVGERFLDNANSGTAPPYHTVDASLGYRYGNWAISLIGHNLGNRRDLISQSEFSEVATTVGPSQQPATGAATAHYRMPARSVMLSLRKTLP